MLQGNLASASQQQLSANFTKCPTPRDPEIAGELSALEVSIETLRDALRELGVRLAPVTRQEPVGDNRKELAAPPARTELGSRIRTSAGHIQEVVLLVRQQIELTEL